MYISRFNLKGLGNTAEYDLPKPSVDVSKENGSTIECRFEVVLVLVVVIAPH